MSAADRPHDTGADAGETARLARGGRTTFFGYVLRLLARLPFLFIAGRLYGAEALGRFAYAAMVVELVAMFATLGLKRGLAEAMARRGRDAGEAGAAAETHSLYDALVVSLVAAGIGALLLIALPGIVFPTGEVTPFDRLFPLIILAIVVSDIGLAGLAFRLDIAATVRARSVIEPWTLSLVALALAFTVLKPDGLIIAYAASMLAAALATLVPMRRQFARAPGWRVAPKRLWLLARSNLPLAGADISEWGARRLDIFILGRFASAEIVGIYYVAQQIASLPQRVKSSFDPILAPVLTTNLAAGQMHKVAAHIRQISFWVAATQLAVVLALGLTGRASMGLFGPVFASGVVVLAVLLTVELFAAQASVAESALIYIARHSNLVWSLSGIAVQIGLSLVLVPRYGGVGAAAALAASALLLSVAKSRLLAAKLGAPVSGWRWVLLLAALPTVALGLALLKTPEWFQLTIGLAAILGLFGGIVWRWGFKGADRLLFARRLKTLEAEAGLADQPS
jgi:O-antigen/teichoic acid export membrane protein